MEKITMYRGIKIIKHLDRWVVNEKFNGFHESQRAVFTTKKAAMSYIDRNINATL